MTQLPNAFFDIKHHGAIDGVTGSCHELVLPQGKSILIDCGLFQGDEISGDGSNFHRLEINFPVEPIQALVVTHVHIDHVGRIPYLLAAGFKGPIICSQPSAVLLPLVLEDAVRIGFTKNERLITRFLQQLERQLLPLPYKSWHQIYRDDVSLKVKLSPAGHILGSAYVECLLGRGREKQRLVFSGDLGAPHTPLLPAPKSPYQADCVVLESTYGDRVHEDRRNRRRRLKALIEQALQNRGVVLIPAFSIGRTQEILYELEGIIHSFGDLPVRQGLSWGDLEVIVDSPLAAKFTQTYRRLKPYWDKEAHRRVRSGRHPLAFEQMLTIDDHQTHLQTVDYLAKSGRPAIVLAASGMCAGGRVVNYLKALIENPLHDILFVGYQAKGTPGRVIQEYGPKGGYVELDGKRFDIRARVHSISGYSAHADQHDLINFIKRMRKQPREVRLVHGDDEAKLKLKAALEAMFREMVVKIPG